MLPFGADGRGDMAISSCVAPTTRDVTSFTLAVRSGARFAPGGGDTTRPVLPGDLLDRAHLLQPFEAPLRISPQFLNRLAVLLRGLPLYLSQGRAFQLGFLFENPQTSPASTL